MPERAGRWVVPLLLTVGLLAATLARVPKVSAEPPSYSQVRADGVTMVWSVTYEGQNTIYSRPVNSSQVTQVATDGLNPDVSGDNVVWEQWNSGESSVIAGKNLKTGSTFQVSPSDGLNVSPAISGNWVVWIHADANANPNAATHQSLMVRNLDGDEATTLVPPTDGTDDRATGDLRNDGRLGRVTRRGRLGSPGGRHRWGSGAASRLE